MRSPAERQYARVCVSRNIGNGCSRHENPNPESGAAAVRVGAQRGYLRPLITVIFWHGNRQGRSQLEKNYVVQKLLLFNSSTAVYVDCANQKVVLQLLYARTKHTVHIAYLLRAERD